MLQPAFVTTMKTNLKISTMGFATSPLPIVLVRNYTLSKGKLKVLCCLERPIGYDEAALGNMNSALRDTKIKFVCTTNEDLAIDIANKKMSLSQDFGGLKNASQIIIDGLTVFQKNEDLNLYRRKNTSYDLFEELVYSDITFQNLDFLSLENLDYLAVAAFPYITGQTENGTEAERYFTIGKVNFDVIIKNSKRVLQNSVVTNACGDHYPGEIEKALNNSFIGGNRNNQITLSSATVANFKVQDDRYLDEITNRFANSNNVGTQNSAGNVYDSKKAQFSNLWSSLDPNRNIRFAFAIDCREIYLNNLTSLANFTMSEDLLTSLMGYIKISNLSVYRHGPLEGSGDVNLIVSTEDQGPRSLRASTYEKPGDGNSPPSVIGSIREVFLQSNASRTGTNSYVRFFTCTDSLLGLTSSTVGSYHYGVEIKFENNLDQWFKNEIYLPLEDTVRKLKEYIALVELQGGEFVSPLYSRFKQSFVDTDLQRKEGVLRECIETYVETLSLVTDVTTRQQKEIANNIAVRTYPMSGNMSGLTAFLQLMDQLLSVLVNIKSSFDENTQSTGEKSEHESNTSHKPEKTFVVVKNFKSEEEIVTLDCLNNTGLGYIFDEKESIEDVGLAVVTKGHWAQLMFRQGVSDGSEAPRQTENISSYLSPIYVQSGGNVINLYQNNTQINFIGLDAVMAYREIQRNGVSSDIEYFQDVISDEQLVVEQLNVANGLQGLTSTSNQEALGAVLGSGFVDQGEDDNNDADNYGFPAGTDGEQANIEQLQAPGIPSAAMKSAASEDMISAGLMAELIAMQGVSTSAVQVLDNQYKPTSQSQAPPADGGQDIEAINDSMNAGSFSGVPGQVGNLAGSAQFINDDGDFELTALNKSEFNIRSRLQLIKALVGFGPGGVKDEIWQALTPDIFERHNVLMIHMAGTYTNVDMGMKDIYPSCPVFHEYFILGYPLDRASMTATSVSGHILPSSGFYPEFTDSLPEYLMRNEYKRMYASKKAKQDLVYATNIRSPRSGQRPFRSGNTSTNSNHYHIYEVDENGNGIAHEACRPGYPGVCHSHRIVNWVVQSGDSSHHGNGIGPHIHEMGGRLRLRRPAQGSAPATGGRRTATTGQSRGTGGGGMSGGGGGSSY
jgi:hypothetical protein